MILDRLLISEHLSLSLRTIEYLQKAGVVYMKDLLKLTDRDLFKIQNLGKKSYKEILDELQKKELKLLESRE